MLTFFRRGVMAKLMLGVLFLSLVAIVITGFGTGGMGGLGELGGLGQSNVARVGGESISTQRVKQEADRQLERMRQQDPNIDMVAFVRKGFIDDIVDQLIGVVSTVVFGKDHGLAASRTMIDREIASIPAFQGITGKFDYAAMQQALSQQKLTEQDLREEIETRLIERQLVLPAAGSAHVPLGFATQYAALLLESRTGSVGVVPSGAMGAGNPPTDQEVKDFYARNIARYTIPERRALRFAPFGIEAVAAAATPTAAEIQDYYRRNQAQYGGQETRTLSQVVLQDEKAARAFAQKVAAGTPFAAAAAQAGYGASDISLGAKTRDELTKVTSANIADAVFAAAKGASVGPLRSGLGWHIVRVDDVKHASVKPLDAVRPEIAARLQQEKGQAALADLAARIEDQIEDGASFEQIAQKEHLAIQETPPVTQAGLAPDAAGYQVPADAKALLDAAFQMESGDRPAVETITANARFALVYVAKVVPPTAPPLAQIRDRVTGDLAVGRALDRARAVAQSIVSKINAGMDPAAAFQQAQVRLPAIKPISATRRDIARQGQQVPPPLAMLFSLPRGKARLLPLPDNQGFFIVHLASITPGDPTKEPAVVPAVRGQFSQILGDEYAQQFMSAIRGTLKIKRNESALAKLKRDLGGAGGGGQ
ncbi:MAG: peptidyl-prolyl cis-trans isomerase [Allosphingosinicella sp.]